MTADPYEAAAASAARRARLTGETAHDVAVVVGSGWAPAADALTAGQPGASPTEVPLADLGGVAPPTVAGHAAGGRAVGVRRPRGPRFPGRAHPHAGAPVAPVGRGGRAAGRPGRPAVGRHHP